METFPSLDAVWQHVCFGNGRPAAGIHGPSHWVRVERNGLFLAESLRLNPVVLSLFALFHDCRRENDNHDPEHGARGAAYARTLRSRLRSLLPSDEEFEGLLEACEDHTGVVHHADPLIGACWDADRLDLGRYGVWIEPRSKYLNTAPAKRLVDSGDFAALKARPVRALGEP